MTRQLWGTYSVNDHCIPSAFVADIVLYDRLVVPVPPPDDHAEFKRWQDNGWRPERLRLLLGVDGLGSFVRQVPWDAERRADWKQMHPARGDGADQGMESDDAFGHAAEDLETTSEGARQLASSGMDPFGDTRRVLRMALTQQLLDGADARVLTVYTSPDRFDRQWRIKKSFPFFSRETTVVRSEDDFDVEQLTVEEQETLAAQDELASVLVGEFALPVALGSEIDDHRDKMMLQQAVDILHDKNVATKREAFHQFVAQYEPKQLPQARKVKEFADLLTAYNESIRKRSVAKWTTRGVTVLRPGVSAGGSLLLPGAGVVAGAAVGMIGTVAAKRATPGEWEPTDIRAAALIETAGKLLRS